jgi:DNA-binding response OmpR family regulator
MNDKPESGNASGGSGQGKRILVVEDDLVVQRAVRDLLISEGYEVLAALDGAEGMKQAQHVEPDLILLDLGLPSDPFGGGNFDGFGVMQWLGRRMSDRKIPVIILTARQDAQSRQHAFDCGASAYLTKPFKSEELLKAIRIVLDEI